MPHVGRALPSTVETLVQTVVHDYVALQQQLRMWRRWLLLIGVLQLVVGQTLNMPLGVVLLVLAAASFVVHEAVVLMVFGMVLLGGALINISHGQPAWLPVALVQVGCAVLLLRCYARYHPAEERYAQLVHGLDIGLPPPVTYAAAVLPWLGIGTSLLAWGLSVFSSVPLTSAAQQPTTTYLPLDLAVVGLALCVASLAQRRAPALAVLGVIASVLVLWGWIAMLFIW